MLTIDVEAIIVDEFGQVLLQRPEAVPLWSIPGGWVEQPELPTTAVTRIVEQTTSLKTLPVRLVGLYETRDRAGERLTFLFRCLKRGGVLSGAPATRQVGYFETGQLPADFSPPGRRRLRDGLDHAGGPPRLVQQRQTWLLQLFQTVVRPWRSAGQARATTAAPSWGLMVVALVRDGAGRLLWLAEDGRYHLPAAPHQPGRAPWEVADRLAEAAAGQAVADRGLAAVYLAPGERHLTLCFANDVLDSSRHHFPPGDEPETAVAEHRQLARDSAGYDGDQPTRFEPLPGHR